MLTLEGLVAEAAKRPGLVPTSILNQPIQAETDTIVWTDLGKWHLNGGFFRDSMAEMQALSRQPLIEYHTPASALRAVDWRDSLEPAALIFHAGRCGSTLLSTALARSRQLLVYCEAAPHNQIWGLLGDRGESDLRLYRVLCNAMGRRRSSSWIAQTIKFTSYNVLEWNFINRAFPKAPALFLFRDPSETLASFAKRPPGWLGKELAIGRRWDRADEAIEEFFRAALVAQGPSFRCLNYRDLVPENLAMIVRYLGLDAVTGDLERMRSAFSWDAKSGIAAHPFAPVSSSGSAVSASAELRTLYLRLDDQARTHWSFY